jgi:hypothetical protein
VGLISLITSVVDNRWKGGIIESSIETEVRLPAEE